MRRSEVVDVRETKLRGSPLSTLRLRGNIRTDIAFKPIRSAHEEARFLRFSGSKQGGVSVR